MNMKVHRCDPLSGQRSLDLGSGGDDLGAAVGRVALERLGEHASELLALELECILVGPGLDGVEELLGDGPDGLGDFEVEDGEVGELGLGERSVVDAVWERYASG